VRSVWLALITVILGVALTVCSSGRRERPDGDGDLDVDADVDGDVDSDGDGDSGVERCGDGVLQPWLDEHCDDGAGNSDVEPDACRTDCLPADCGDGVVDTAEECDDGNGDNDDGCTTFCVDVYEFLCAPCELDDECGRAEDLCVPLEGGAFCLARCEGSELCPTGYVCDTVMPSEDWLVEMCVPEAGTCVPCEDGDGDGYGVGPECLGPDCDDADPLVHPGAEELCNGRDDDCVGGVDDVAGAGEACGTGQPGICAAGVRACGEGGLVCVRSTEPRPEGCDNMGADDDCDGEVDDVEGLDGWCDTGELGRCVEGEALCDDGALECVGRHEPRPEGCGNMGTDDDCDGLLDDVEGLGGDCDTSVPGICAEGTMLCGDGGHLICVPDEPPRREQCHGGEDEDCDGLVDCGDPGDCLGQVCDPSSLPSRVCQADGSCDLPEHEDCTNRVDDDGDGHVDCGDVADCPIGAGCSPTGSGAVCSVSTSITAVCAETDCNILTGDEDGDGLANCADPDCRGEVCGFGGVCSGGHCRF